VERGLRGIDDGGRVNNVNIILIGIVITNLPPRYNEYFLAVNMGR
jgi:hypothetical protein